MGCALGGSHRDDPEYGGELYLLGVLPEYQRHGIGRRLLAAIAERLARDAVHSLLVRVLMVNPNRHFYERLGAQYMREEVYNWNGVLLGQAVYGWLDTTAIRQQPQ